MKGLNGRKFLEKCALGRVQFLVNLQTVNFTRFCPRMLFEKFVQILSQLPANIYLFKVNNKTLKEGTKYISKLPIKTKERLSRNNQKGALNIGDPLAEMDYMILIHAV